MGPKPPSPYSLLKPSENVGLMKNKNYLMKNKINQSPLLV